MTVSQIDTSAFVDVQVDISPTAVPFNLFSVPLILDDSNVIDTTNRTRTYGSIQAVGADFGNSAPAYNAATVFFEQTPQPATVMIGRWASTATAGELEGAFLTPTQQIISNWTSVTTGAFFIYLNGIPYAVTGLSFASATNLNGVASAIQTALQAILSGTTCVWNANYGQFIISSPTTGALSSVGYVAAPTAVGDYHFTGQPSPNDTITIGGTLVTFVASGASGSQVNIGGSLPITLSNLLTFLQSSSDPNLIKATYVNDGVAFLYVVYGTPGTSGNSFTLAKSGTNIAVSAATLAGATGTDISAKLGLTLAAFALPVPGVAAESLLSAVQACANSSSLWYGAYAAYGTVVTPSILDHTAVAAYILASNRYRLWAISLYGQAVGGTAIVSPAITSDLASVMQSLNNKRVVMMYSSFVADSVMTLYGRAFTVNFDASLSTITLAYKQAPGIQGENLTSTQFNSIVAKGGNVVVIVDNGAVMIWPGQMSNGFWFDEVHGVDWFANRIQIDVFNAFYQTQTKIPQTDDGNNQLAGVIAGSARAAVQNGLVAPGQWNASGFGQLVQGMALPTGYYIWYPPIATQAQTTREARVTVPFQVAGKLAGASQIADVILNINR